MAFVIKAEIRDTQAKTFAFRAQKTMYGGKHIAKGDTVHGARCSFSQARTRVAAASSRAASFSA